MAAAASKPRAISRWPPRAGTLADLRAALAGGMDGWQDRAEDPQSLHDALRAVIEARGGGAEIVAEADANGITVHDRDMGTAGRRYAGLSS